ncbi:MFS transporter, partial [Streptomyces sp. NPDC058398]
GMGLAMTPATTAITDALPRSLQNVGSAMNDLARELGGALGIAVLGSLLSAAYRDHLSLPGLPPQVAEAARSSLAAAHAIGGPVSSRATTAFVDGMHLALLGAAAAAVLAAVAVAVLLRSAPSPEAFAEDDEALDIVDARKQPPREQPSYL